EVEALMDVVPLTHGDELAHVLDVRDPSELEGRLGPGGGEPMRRRERRLAERAQEPSRRDSAGPLREKLLTRDHFPASSSWNEPIPALPATTSELRGEPLGPLHEPRFSNLVSSTMRRGSPVYVPSSRLSNSLIASTPCPSIG